ncbi:MAG: hypothetical protein K6L60_02905 [Oceanobacter sp.]
MTSLVSHSYSRGIGELSSSLVAIMSEMQLQSLEDKVLKLLARNRELVDEIASMKSGSGDWEKERSELLRQNEAARRQVNKMIKQIEVLERNSGE